ncbi:MAG: hypothetical protein JKX92_01215 [Porticoccaceae bacterium]|nr:hypothetical protein [Porticoccaceae bacterium]
MKKVMFAGMVLVVGAVNVFADCTTDPAVSASVLAGTYVDASGGTGNWKESHCSGGELWKAGDNDPENPLVDPPAQIGTWSTSGDFVTYIYTRGKEDESFTFELHKNDNGTPTEANDDTYYFCESGVVKATGSLSTSTTCGS